jgi:murein DD-endopeptidase MepM/ murein hydrolase activator NlpD
MHSRLKTLTASSYIFISLAVLFPLPHAWAGEAEDLKQAIEEKAKALQVINAQIQTTQQNLSETTSKSKTLKKEITQLDYQLNQLGLGIRSSEIKIDKLDLEIQSLNYGITDKEVDIVHQREAIKSFVRALAENDRETTLVRFLKHQSLADSLLETESIRTLNLTLAERVRSLLDLKRELEGDLSETQTKRSQVATERQVLTNRKGIAEDTKKGRADLLASTKNQEKLYQEQLKELEAKQAEVGAQIESIEQELRAKFDVSVLPVKYSGVFSYPIPGAIMSQSYGTTAFAQKAYSTKFHNGLDFGAALGTPVLAARDGKVVAVGNNGKYQYGRYVLIEHDNGLSSLYAHLSKQSAVQGATIKRGELLGFVGNTGYSFGSHLHFTLYWTPSVLLKILPTCNCGPVPVGVTVDPQGYL